MVRINAPILKDKQGQDKFILIRQEIEKLKKNGYTVETSFVDRKTSLERAYWIRSNTSGQYTNSANVNESRVTYFFEDQDDALVFKMRWG